MLLKLISKILGDPNQKEIDRINKIVQKINEIEQQYQKLSDDELKAKTEEFKQRCRDGETLDKILPEAFATVKNACRRLMGNPIKIGRIESAWDMIPFDVQLVGGVVLHEGKIAEMKTGEGKTLVAVLPVYLNALSGKGVHVITVNDYLAKRDADWMGNVYKYLGFTVGVVVHGLNPEERKAAYNADITYGTNNEFGFDYLRDNMVDTLDQCVQRQLNYTIVDEVDSILVDEARTPLIISAPSEESTSKYMQYSHLVRQLEAETHFEIDEKMKTAVLTEEGIKRMEELMGVENIYTESGIAEVHHIEQALKAQAIFKNDIDYVVKDEEIIIVDEFTGRLMPGRRYSEGLHQAIEAKESVEVKRESKTLATITFQNLFRLYDKLAGMTGTAATEAEEFAKIYNLDVVIIPTNVLVTRDDKADSIYKTEHGKFLACIKNVVEKNKRGQPVLVGTISIEKSEVLSRMLKKEGVSHNVLNAKYHEKEAEIVAGAGQKGAVTIATNMAGRGTDIQLGEGVKECGGLAIMGTERHEARRIDNQLRGRSGRQGDPGESQFYISLEDSLMRLFGSERVKKMMDFLKVPEDMPIENAMISKSIESAQKKVEGHHFDIRKHLVEYDDIMNKHREIIYRLRRKVLEWEQESREKEDGGSLVKEEMLKLLKKVISTIAINHTNSRNSEEWDHERIIADIQAIHASGESPLKVEELQSYTHQEDLIDKLYGYLAKELQKKEESLGPPDVLYRLERSIYLRTIDTFWMQHIDDMTRLRENVALRGYGQRDPLLEYKEEAYHMFRDMLGNIDKNTINTIFKITIQPTERITLQSQPQERMVTNEEEIESQLSEADIETKPKVVKTESSGPIKSENIGRNDPCPCGSGKKYKKCCGKL